MHAGSPSRFPSLCFLLTRKSVQSGTAPILTMCSRQAGHYSPFDFTSKPILPSLPQAPFLTSGNNVLNKLGTKRVCQFPQMYRWPPWKQLPAFCFLPRRLAGRSLRIPLRARFRRNSTLFIAVKVMMRMKIAHIGTSSNMLVSVRCEFRSNSTAAVAPGTSVG